MMEMTSGMKATTMIRKLKSQTPRDDRTSGKTLNNKITKIGIVDHLYLSSSMLIGKVWI